MGFQALVILGFVVLLGSCYSFDMGRHFMEDPRNDVWGPIPRLGVPRKYAEAQHVEMEPEPEPEPGMWHHRNLHNQANQLNHKTRGNQSRICVVNRSGTLFLILKEENPSGPPGRTQDQIHNHDESELSLRSWMEDEPNVHNILGHHHGRSTPHRLPNRTYEDDDDWKKFENLKSNLYWGYQ